MELVNENSTRLYSVCVLLSNSARPVITVVLILVANKNLQEKS